MIKQTPISFPPCLPSTGYDSNPGSVVLPKHIWTLEKGVPVKAQIHGRYTLWVLI